MIIEFQQLAEEWFGANGVQTGLSMKLNAAFDRVGFTEEYVDRRIGEAKGALHAKVIKDNVWGMIEVDGSSIRLLDCPIVQRLRGIKQLGFSYLTYPSAEHSRFAHSLGMYGVVAKFLEASSRIKSIESNSNYRIHIPDDSTKSDLLHAAVLHDIGHMPFSHASEYALQSLPKLNVGGVSWEDFIEPMERSSLIKSPKLAELLSVLCILAPRFRKYYREYVRHNEPDEIAESAPFRIASLILGRPPTENGIGYAELISGRLIDADKLDYVSRDGVACGIPVGIDIGRLFLRSSFLEVFPLEMERLYRGAGINRKATQSQIQFIVNSSGKDTIEEVISARTSLYHRVYFHQTTRNAERLLEKAIQAASTVSSGLDILDALSLWSISDVELLSALKASESSSAGLLASRLISRDLLKRAMIFGSADLEMIFPIRSVLHRLSSTNFEEDLRNTILPDLEKGKGQLLSFDRIQRLEEDIATEAAVLRCKIEQLDFQDIRRPLVAILAIQQSPEAKDSCLVLQNDELVLSTELHNVTQTSAAEDIFKASGYVLTEPGWREFVHIASRKVLTQRTAKWVECELRVNEQSESNTSTVNEIVNKVKGYRVLQVNSERVIRRTGLNKEKIEQLEVKAAKAGYFDKFPFISSRPTVNWLTLENNLTKFDGQYGWRITKELTEAYVWQYPPVYREQAKLLLNSIIVLDRFTIASKLRQSLEKVRSNTRNLSKIRIVSLSPNSGNEVRIALEERYRGDSDFSKKFSIHHSISEAFKELGQDQHIVLIDDNIVSGTQATAQLAWWLAIDKSTWPSGLADESNVDCSALQDSDAQQLGLLIRSARISICVCVGAPSQASKKLKWLVSAVQSKETSKSTQDQLFEQSSPALRVYCAEELLSAKSIFSKEFEAFLSSVGAECYAFAKYGATLASLSKDKRKICKGNSSGYDNMRGTTLTFRNAPVSTYTALWCPGIFEDRPWFPLAIRRGYFGKLVLA